MDLTCVDCTVLKINIGEYVSFWGDESCKYSKLNNIAKKFNSIPYVYLTSITNRVKRIYVYD